MIYSCIVAITSFIIFYFPIILDRPKILSCLTELCDDFRGAINDGKDCADCYINDGFAKVCNEPHLVVWIKWIDSCYWPAKLIVVQNGGFVKVKLFGSHEEVRVFFNNCYLCAEMTTFQLQNASTAYDMAKKVRSTSLKF